MAPSSSAFGRRRNRGATWRSRTFNEGSPLWLPPVQGGGLKRPKLGQTGHMALLDQGVRAEDLESEVLSLFGLSTRFRNV